ncbi:MAG TPA: dCTP deaminase [Gaiella sp.]|jgi:deoxycytidine triphosphate deaminase|nr:dCTP deaminase [Gaiella sp.]
MVLSDQAIRRLVEAGRIGIDPYDPLLMQPSSLDVRVDRLFRVFRNSRYPYIDVKADQDELTELVEVEGDEPFILHPGEFVLGSTLERVTLPDDLVARLEGKALALDTEVPTSQGWRLMAEIRPGDIVFGADGEPTVVLAATEPLVDRPCKEVRFSDGTTIVCDAAHEWETVDKNGRRRARNRARVVTTAEIEKTLVVRGERNHQVALAGAVRYSEKELPIDPYVFGAWLGDGTTTTAEITSADAEILEEIALAGYAVRPTRTRRLVYRIGGAGHTRDPRSGRYAPNESLASTLRAMGMSLGKRIPSDYLRASVPQRQALLEGLMDTDGYVDVLGRCDLTTVHEPLAYDVMELVASLGFRPTLAYKRAMLNGRDCGPKYEVQFTPDRPVFRLPRKLARQKRHGRFHRFRAIVDVRDVANVPVRCIEVSSPRGVYLATRSFIPTHNSSLGRLGLLIHSTAGFIDPGFDGHVTLELSNVANLPITIYPEMKIGQLSFVQMSEPAETPYGSGSLGSKYQGQRGPTPSRYWQNFLDPS